MRIVTLDFETHYAADYSLSKMSPLEYVMDDRFQTISCSIKVDNHNTDVFFGEAAVRKAFKSIDGIIRDSLLLAHNMAGFDAYVCAYRYDLKPKLWGCTMAMARPIHAKTTGLGLAKLVAHYGLGIKDNTVLVQTRGKRLEDFTPQELEAMRKYNREDTDQCRALFDRLRKHYTPAELWQIDAIIRMRTEPAFVLDVPMLETAASIERTRKHKALLDLARDLNTEGVPALDWGDEEAVTEFVRGELASAPKFSAMLEKLGVEVPMKPSPTNPEKTVPALAKTDEAFIALQEHDDPLVSAAARARLDVKSTLLETRIQKFLTAGRLAGGHLPVPLRYCGADTTGRDSGEEYNCQNLPRVNPDKPQASDALRNSLRAGKGKKVIVADQSGIELRTNHFLWKEPASMALYQASPDKADLYRSFAADNLYRIKPEEVSKPQRQIGKVAQLGLGFGSGATTFQRIAKIMGGVNIPLDGTQRKGAELTCEDVVSSWRTAYSNIVEGWKTCGRALQWIADGLNYEVDPWGLVSTCKEGFLLPSGRLIRYPDLRQEEDGSWPDGRPRTSWFYANGRHKARITGPKADENCLAGDTLVLTDSGWKPIANLLEFDRVHDGVEFVQHSGIVPKGIQPCVEVDGVRMTADHEVLTDEGWTEAGQNPRPYRPDIRHANRSEPGRAGQGQPPHDVEVPLRVRTSHDQTGHKSEAGSTPGGHAQLRVRDEPAHVGEGARARHVQAPSVWGVPVDGRQMPAANAPGVEELRGAGHNGVRALADVRAFLGRHGAVVPPGVGPGPEGQRRPILAGELPVGEPQRKHDEQAQLHSAGGHPPAEPGVRDWQVDPVQPAEKRMAPGQADNPTRPEEPVFDILNCGPRHRFVVLGEGGPFIVHNCVQALARDSIFDCALEYFKRTGLRPALRVHDELVYVVDEGSADELLAELQRVMRAPPKWWPELIVWSEGDVADTYGAAK